MSPSKPAKSPVHMELVRPERVCGPREELSALDPEVSQADAVLFASLTSTELTEEQLDRIRKPALVFPRETELLAVHWHPEFVPMDAIKTRIRTMFPNALNTLVIPTQHNELLEYDGFSGVEVDCYSHGFNRKVQLLLHFKSDKVQGERAGVLRSMLEHTFKYRGSQLFEFLAALCEEDKDALRQKAARESGADAEIVWFVRVLANKIRRLLEDTWSVTPPEMVKNKLVRNFFEAQRDRFGDHVVDRAQVFLKQVKMLVKEGFSLKYFYRASEVIEEARSLGAGVVIPHPEQFWPILLAGYDVDGIEVWNPQSREYTEFLIRAVERENKNRCRTRRPVLIFMGDDCHMGEKTLAQSKYKPEAQLREIGLQPAWDDLAIKKTLILSRMCRGDVIEEYKARLD